MSTTSPVPLAAAAGPSAFRPQTHLITGAARGIGRGLVRLLLRRGHRVFLLDKNDDELRHTLARCAEWTAGAAAEDVGSGDAFRGARVDLADRAAVRRVLREQVVPWCAGRLDVLVNNAFPTPHTWRGGRAAVEMEEDILTLEESEDAVMAEWDEKVAVGLTGAFFLSRLCVGLLAPREERSEAGRAGCIVNIGSTRAWQAEMDHEGYSAVKAGLVGLTRSLSVSLGRRYGIRTNVLSLGWIHVEDECREADEAGRPWEEGLREVDHRWHPAGRVGRVEDVARALEFLRDSGFVTGAEIVVDGGVGGLMVYPEEEKE